MTGPLVARGANVKDARYRASDSSIPQISRVTATEAATDLLRSLILSGEIKSGAVLRQDEVAKQLQVSRTPLREALHRLTAEGLIRLDPHKGAMVAQPSINELRDIYELQEILECEAVKEAVAHRSKDKLEQLRFHMEGLVEIRDSADWIRYNLGFHTCLYEMSDKPLLVEMITMLRNRASLYINMVARSDQSRIRAEHEHREMFAALERGDVGELQRLVHAHLGATLAWVDEVIRMNSHNKSDGSE